MLLQVPGQCRGPPLLASRNDKIGKASLVVGGKCGSGELRHRRNRETGRAQTSLGLFEAFLDSSLREGSLRFTRRLEQAQMHQEPSDFSAIPFLKRDVGKRIDGREDFQPAGNGGRVSLGTTGRARVIGLAEGGGAISPTSWKTCRTTGGRGTITEG